jgi:hypothetical protein
MHTAMNIPVSYLLTGCGAVGCSRSTVQHSVCCLLYVLVRRTAYSLCVVCCTGLCSYSAALQHLQHLQSATQPTDRCYRYKLSVISPSNCNLDQHIIKYFEFSVRWNIRMRRQMMRHAGSTVTLPTTQCWNEDRCFESVPGKVVKQRWRNFEMLLAVCLWRHAVHL